jgi:putative transposase
VSQEDAVYRVATAFGGCVPKAGRAEGKQNRGGSYSTGSRAHVDLDPAEIRGVAGDRFIKGKSAIHLARVYGEKKRNFVGQHFWARGFFVSTVGRDQEVIREYIRKQQEEDKRLEQMNLWR